MIISTGIIVRDNRVLIGKVEEQKLEEFGDITYIFPGGKVEEGETYAEACTRELKEETNLLVEVVAEIHSRIHPATGREIHYFHCKYLGGDPKLNPYISDDIGSFIWVKIDELKEYLPTIADEVYEYLTKLI